MAAEAIGAFLAGFTDQYLELKREQRQADQFQQSLQIHEMALKLQQLRHDQSLALQERQQTNLEAHQREQERVNRFQALSGAANVQSQIEQRKIENEQKDRDRKRLAIMGRLAAESKPTWLELQKNITGRKMAGLDTTAEEAKMRSLGQALSEADLFIQEEQQRSSGQQPQQRGGPMLTGEDESAEGPQPLGEETEEVEPEGPPLPQQPAAQPSPGRMPAAPGGHAPAGPQPIAQQGGPGIQPPVPVRLVETESGPEADALNKLFDSIGVFSIRARSKGQKTEEDLKKDEAQVKSWAAQSITALDHKDEIDNALARHGVNARMTGHGKQSVHLGGHASVRIGGSLGQNASTGISESTTETQAPKVEFEFGEKAFGLDVVPLLGDLLKQTTVLGGGLATEDLFKQPDVADRIATALVEHDQQYKTVSQPIIIGAQGVIQEGRDEIFRLVGRQAKTIERHSFDAILDAKRHKAAQISESLPPAELKLTAITKGPLPPVGGYPNVVDKKESLDETIGRFGQALTKVGKTVVGSPGTFQVRMPPKVEQSMLFELKRRMQPDMPDGTYSKAAQAKAKEIIDGPLQSRHISPEMRSAATNILADIAVNKQKPELPTEGMLNGYAPPRGTAERALRETVPGVAALGGLARTVGPGGKLGPQGQPERPILPETIKERREMEQREKQPYVSVKYPKGKPPERSIKYGREEAPKGGGVPTGLVGLGVRAGIIGAMAAQENVDNVNKSFRKVKDAKAAERERMAKDQVTPIKNEHARMTDKEKKDMKGTWATIKNTWKNVYHISDAIIKEVDDIIQSK